jgi:thiol:disulfide interchange protein
MAMKTISKKLILPTTIIAFLLIAAGIVCAAVSVGVQKGNWIEYQVTLTGSPPADHEVTWARMEVTAVQGKTVSLNVTTQFANGTLLYESVTLNLETGQLGDDFIIPANLTTDDTFLDQYHGNITISGVEERTYASATRTVVYASTAQSIYYWDKATGILVEGTSTFEDYTIHSVVDETNMWQPQILGLEPIIVYALLITAAAAVIAVAVLFALRRRK